MKTRILGHLPLLAACVAGAAHAAATQTIVTRPGTAAAANYLTVGLSEEHSDNITRATTGADSAWTTGAVTDFRSDQFSFGLVLHEMLTGRQPFDRPTAAETMAAELA